ncbi:MAG: hypothetical protein V7K25_02510 [Nostoc sp.]|uniref:hypothetical protein n=1 Tax=Nostoc sp. TaxID=1180 RepID=UPI002FF8F434
MSLKPYPKEFKRVKIAIAAIAISNLCFYPDAIAINGETTVWRIADGTKRRILKPKFLNFQLP